MAVISRIVVYSADHTGDFDLYLLDEKNIKLRHDKFNGITIWPLRRNIHPVITARKIVIEAVQEMKITEVEVFGTFEKFSNPNLYGGKNNVVFYVENGESTCALYDIDNVVISANLTDSDLIGCDITEDDIVSADEDVYSIFSSTDTNWNPIDDNVIDRFDLSDNVIDRFDLSNFFEVRHTDGDDEYTDLHDDDDAAYSDQSQSFHLQMQIGIKLIIMCLIGLI